MDSAVLLETDQRGVATLTLNRAARHNAFDDAMIAELADRLAELHDDRAVRVVILRATGKSFSAGADLGWMRRMASFDFEENERDAMVLATMMQRLDRLCKPTIALVHGAAYGGGVGLVACCDIALATPSARFCLSEVRLGLIPAVIAPYVVRAIGARAARRYFQTAEVFEAEEARRLGLVSDCVAEAEIEPAVERLVAALLAAGPDAQAAAKRLVDSVADRPIDMALLGETARRIADRRASEEGREGVTAFLEKRRPAWRND